MLTLNEQTKKVFKILGTFFVLLFLWGVFSLFMNAGSNNSSTAPLSSNLSSGKSAPGMMSMQDNLAQEGSYAMDSEEMKMPSRTEANLDLNKANSSDKKVIKNGSLSLKVEKTEESANKIYQIARDQQGEVFSTNFYERVKGQKSGNMTIKVPVAKFEETVEKIKLVATQVISESTTGQDVTEQYADLQAQLKNKRAEEESFVKILDRAGKIDDVLAVTQQISRVRGEIERLEGRVKYLESQADMSTIVVSLSEDIEIAPVNNNWRPWQVVKKSVSELLESMQEFVDGLIRFVVVTLPSFVIFLLIIWIIWVVVKRIYKKVFKKA